MVSLFANSGRINIMILAFETELSGPFITRELIYYNSSGIVSNWTMVSGFKRIRRKEATQVGSVIIN